jgi:hypothetical protein
MCVSVCLCVCLCVCESVCLCVYENALTQREREREEREFICIFCNFEHSPSMYSLKGVIRAGLTSRVTNSRAD